MHAPPSGNRYKRRIQTALNFHANFVKLKRYQCRRIGPTVHIRLITPNIRIVNCSRVRYHRIAHRRRRHVSFRRPRHRQRWRRNRSFIVVNSLCEVESEFNGAGELVSHRRHRRWVFRQGLWNKWEMESLEVCCLVKVWEMALNGT